MGVGEVLKDWGTGGNEELGTCGNEEPGVGGNEEPGIGGNDCTCSSVLWKPRNSTSSAVDALLGRRARAIRMGSEQSSESSIALDIGQQSGPPVGVTITADTAAVFSEFPLSDRLTEFI